MNVRSPDSSTGRRAGGQAGGQAGRRAGMRDPPVCLAARDAAAHVCSHLLPLFGMEEDGGLHGQAGACCNCDAQASAVFCLLSIHPLSVPPFPPTHPPTHPPNHHLTPISPCMVTQTWVSGRRAPAMASAMGCSTAST